MAEIICTKCGKAITVPAVQEGQDNTTFVCDICQDKINLPAFQAELAELEAKADKTESELTRIEFLKAKIASTQG